MQAWGEGPFGALLKRGDTDWVGYFIYTGLVHCGIYGMGIFHLIIELDIVDTSIWLPLTVSDSKFTPRLKYN